MIKNEKARMWVNRILSILLGGIAVFLVMTVSVVSSVKRQNEELEKELYEPTALLNDAIAYFEKDNYSRAKDKLNILFEKHPGSNEAAEGKKISVEMETVAQKEQELQIELDKKWDTAVGAIREDWAVTMAAKLILEFDENREQLEKNMDEVLDKEWEKMKAQIREEWEKS